MLTHISGRGVALSPALRRRVEAKLTRASRFLRKVTEARVVLALERYRHLAEVTLQAKGATLHAEGAASDFQTAVDLALRHLDEQVRRRKERLRARKSRRAAEPGAGPPLGADLAEEPAVVVRRLDAKPMSVDEALEQLQIRRDGFLVFTNARSRAVNVLRRRPDGRLELVEPAG